MYRAKNFLIQSNLLIMLYDHLIGTPVLNRVNRSTTWNQDLNQLTQFDPDKFLPLCNSNQACCPKKTPIIEEINNNEIDVTPPKQKPHKEYKSILKKSKTKREDPNETNRRIR